jgi:hypothetical protein
VLWFLKENFQTSRLSFHFPCRNSITNRMFISNRSSYNMKVEQKKKTKAISTLLDCKSTSLLLFSCLWYDHFCVWRKKVFLSIFQSWMRFHLCGKISISSLWVSLWLLSLHLFSFHFSFLRCSSISNDAHLLFYSFLLRLAFPFFSHLFFLFLIMVHPWLDPKKDVRASTNLTIFHIVFLNQIILLIVVGWKMRENKEICYSIKLSLLFSESIQVMKSSTFQEAHVK